jgi:hypothetical protein
MLLQPACASGVTDHPTGKSGKSTSK